MIKYVNHWLFSCLPIHFIAQVVELIKSAPDDIRPKVLVSATAVGYYGMFVCQNLFYIG